MILYAPRFMWFCLSIFSCNWTLCLWVDICLRESQDLLMVKMLIAIFSTKLKFPFCDTSPWRNFTNQYLISALYNSLDCTKWHYAGIERMFVYLWMNLETAHIIKSPSLLDNVEWHSKMTRRAGMWKTFNNKLIVPIIRCHLSFPNVVESSQNACRPFW